MEYNNLEFFLLRCDVKIESADIKIIKDILRFYADFLKFFFTILCKYLKASLFCNCFVSDYNSLCRDVKIYHC